MWLSGATHPCMNIVLKNTRKFKKYMEVWDIKPGWQLYTGVQFRAEWVLVVFSVKKVKKIL